MHAEARDRTVPASLAQRALWLLARSLPDPAVYNEPNVYRLKGALDIEALERAIGEMVRRHEALRTHFSAIDGEPMQIIALDLSVPLPVTDLRVTRAARETEARASES